MSDFSPSDRLLLLRQLVDATEKAERLEAENRELCARVAEYDGYWLSLGNMVGYHGHPANVVKVIAGAFEKLAKLASKAGGSDGE